MNFNELIKKKVEKKINKYSLIGLLFYIFYRFFFFFENLIYQKKKAQSDILK